MATATQLEKSPPPMVGRQQLTSRLDALLRLGQTRWATMLPRERTWTVAAASLLALVTFGLAWYALRTDWRTLYSDLEPEDARQTALVLTQAQIPFQAAMGGTAIEVPSGQLDKARLATASKGSVKSGRMGFEIFDKPNWVGSEFDEQVNFQRALEGELERTVGSLTDVESARVHLVLPHDSLFREQERLAKASVVLKLRHRSLADGEPEAIRNLVSSAVDGLSPDRVVLVDAAGRVPLGPKTAEALRLNAEQALEDKLIATLEPVTGVGNVRASVTLDYDDAASEQTEETYDPNRTVTLSMQRTEQTAGSQPVAAGVPGTTSNAPNSQAVPVYPQQSTAPQSAKTESGTYAANKTTRHVVQNAGHLRRMTAAIVVNDRMGPPPAKGKPLVWQPRSAEELNHLTALAQAAVGFSTARGDLVTVQDLAFDENRNAQTPSIEARLLTTAENSPVLVKYSALLLGLVVVVLFGIRPAFSRVTAKAGKSAKKELAAEASGQSPDGPPLPLAPPADGNPDRVRAQEIYEQVASHIKREPSQSSRLLQSWIHTE
jgi:flagellar M-ring protein FliF